MNQPSLRVYFVEALHELREGLRGSLVPLMFAGLMFYVFSMLCNAEYLRDIGASDVPRNSPYLVYELTSGQSFWLIFVWAWMFAQPVVRDRAASMHELVLACPVSLRGLLLARYFGALLLACIAGFSSTLGLLLVPALAQLGFIPAAAVGPTPYLALAWAYLLFVLPSAIGLGALYLSCALRTRSNAGPFAAAAIVILLWMIAMVVLRAGDMHLELATLIDASGFGEADRLAKHWTPHEKSTALFPLTPTMLANRLAWMAIPSAWLAWTLARLTREQQCVERAPRTLADDTATASGRYGAPPALGPIGRPSWTRVALAEAGWQLRRTLSGWGFLVTAILWTVINLAAPFVHMLGHAEGPIVPRAAVLAPFLIQLCYLFSIFMVAGFVGTLARRDQRPGLDELVDATPAPLAARVLGSALAAAAVTLTIALLPVLSAWIVPAVAVSGPFAFWDPLLINVLVAVPALLELCAATFVIHALVRSPGPAHALSMFAAFVAIVNNEVGMVSYPPAKFGIPAELALSELAGWTPWLASVLSMDALKLCGVLVLTALAWLAFPRGTALTLRARLRAAFERGRGGAGAMALVSVAAFVAMAALLHHGYVVRGGYADPSERDREDARWEARFAGEAVPFTSRGGEVALTVDPETRTAKGTWTLRGVRAPAGKLSGSLEHGLRVRAARVDGRAASLTSELDHFVIALGPCVSCEVVLELEARGNGFPREDEAPWLHRSGVFARASDLLPRLGFDTTRMLRAPATRQEHGLDARRPDVAAQASVPVQAVAPAGAWRWSVDIAQPGMHSALSGATDGPLDFALVWLPPRRSQVLDQTQLAVWHGPARADVAHQIAEDVTRMQACVVDYLGAQVPVDTVVQIPRGRGATRLHGSLLWLPEHEGWDVAPGGLGQLKRRAAIARALASRWLVDAADLREQPGARWLSEGVAGWLGLECVRAADGQDAWLALLDRGSEHVAEQLGALDAPIVGLADDGAAGWIDEYAPLSVHAWAHATGRREAMRAIHATARRVREGASVVVALESTVGSEAAHRLLGVPLASDVQIASSGSHGAEVRGEHFAWQQGGWQRADNLRAVLRPVDESAPSQLELLPTRVEPGAPFTAFDAWPSYERAPRDNVWRVLDTTAPGQGRIDR